MSGDALAIRNHSLDEAVAFWLRAAATHSGSKHTARAYQRAIVSFRSALQRNGLDLDGAPEMIAKIAMFWASARNRNATRKGGPEVKGASYNQRLACVSSFYRYCVRHALVEGISENPIKRLERRSENDSEHARVFDKGEIAAKLAGIARDTLAGMRDYALLSVAVYTGRRAAELAGLRCGAVQVDGDIVTLTFARTKGGKVMIDQLPAKISAALLRYLRAALGPDFAQLDADAPLWLSFAHNKSAGAAISAQSIADIYQKHLGVSTVHSTRHTFAKAMDDMGAPVQVISRRLGHANIATTQRYLHSLPTPVNPIGDALAEALGIE